MKQFAMLALALLLLAGITVMTWPIISSVLKTNAGDSYQPQGETVGSQLPELTLPATELPQQKVNIGELKGGYSVFMFYPMDNTPGCTLQLCAARDAYPAFQKEGVFVAGVNPGSLESHQQFAKKHNYQYPLIVDEKRQLARALNVKPTLNTVSRTVVITSPENSVIWAKEGSPGADEVLEAIKTHKEANNS